MDFKSLSYQEKERWNNFVLSSPFGHIFQTYEWGEVMKELGWEPLRFLVEENGKILTAGQILVRRKFGFSLLYIPRGPIFSDRESFEFFVGNLKKIMRRKRAIFCKINPAIRKSDEIEKWYVEAGFRKSNIRDMHICTYQINLKQNLETIWKRFRGNVRTAIRKAEKSGVYVKCAHNEKDLRDFYTVYHTLQEKGKITIHNFNFFKKVWEKLAPKGQAKIFNAYLNGKVIATEFILLYGEKAEQMWTANIRLKTDVGASQLIHWRIINWLKENGFSVYDLGGVPPDKNELPGIHFYKSGFGGDFIEYLGEYEISSNPFLYYLWKKWGPLYLKRKEVWRKIAGKR